MYINNLPPLENLLEPFEIGFSIRSPRQKCLHRECSKCHGTGKDKNGVACVHMLHCPCQLCSPMSM